MNKIGTSGNTGKGVRSDCFISIELSSKPIGFVIELKSKVKVLYGDSIIALIKDMLNYYKIENANVSVEDSGALPYVIMARLESSIKQVLDSEKEFLPDFLDQNRYSTDRDRFRFSRLYLPGNSPNLMINAGLHKPDGIILDLEDSVAPSKKAEARFLVRNALRNVDFYGCERMVRINQIPQGLEDIKYVVPHNVNLILVPKCESVDQIVELEKEIEKVKKQSGVKNNVWLMPIIESALGVINAYQIAKSSKNIVALAIGLEDYTADLGTKRTEEASESFFARTQIVNACRAADIQPIDSVFSDVGDMDALRESVLNSKSLGFDGMGCIHPRQISVIQESFAPDKSDIDKAKKIVLAFNEAKAKGLGVVSIGSKMIDPPVVKRALRAIEIAIKLDLLSENWIKEEIV